MCSQSRIVSGTKAEGFSLSITTVLAEILFYSLFVATFLLSHRESTEKI